MSRRDGPLPYVKLYVRDYLSGTARKSLSLEATGAYTLLLCIMWNHHRTKDEWEGLPGDDKTWARMVGVSPHKWRKLRAELIDGPTPVLTVSEKGSLNNSRLVEEWTRAKSKQAKNSKSGRKGAESRWGGGGERHTVRDTTRYGEVGAERGSEVHGESMASTQIPQSTQSTERIPTTPHPVHRGEEPPYEPITSERWEQEFWNVVAEFWPPGLMGNAESARIALVQNRPLFSRVKAKGLADLVEIFRNIDGSWRRDNYPPEKYPLVANVFRKQTEYWQRHTPEAVAAPRSSSSIRTCTFDGCKTYATRDGLCIDHYLENTG